MPAFARPVRFRQRISALCPPSGHARRRRPPWRLEQAAPRDRARPWYPRIMAAVRGSVSRVAAVARHLSTKAAPAESFIDRVKRLGANAMLGSFVSTGVRFDRVLEGLEVTRIDSEAGEVECLFPVTDASSNAYGTLHGGCVTTLVDVVGTMALLSQDPLRAGVSVELSTSFTAAAKAGDSVRCVGRVTKMGRKLGFTQVDLYRVSDGALAASGRHTKAL